MAVAESQKQSSLSICLHLDSAPVWSIGEGMTQRQKLPSSLCLLGDEMSKQIWVCFSVVPLGEQLWH